MKLFSIRGSCKTSCLQLWHGHLARVSWAGRPCHEHKCGTGILPVFSWARRPCHEIFCESLSRAVGCALVAVGVFLLAASCASAASPDDSARAFLWEQAGAQAAAATTPDAYLQAAATYNRLVADSVCNGPLFQNLGGVLVMAGDGVNAAAAFERAERYLGVTPETRQGLAAALALQTGRAQAELPWSRTAFFWHYAFPCSVRASTALAGWSLFWLGVFCQLLRRRGAGRAFLRSLAETCLLTGGLITVVFAASTLMTLAHERHDEATWGARVFAASASETEVAP